MLAKDAKCTHYWRDDLKSYLKQQYGYAYYRLNITRKFGKPYDKVTGIGMILQVPITVGIVVGASLTGLTSPLLLLLLLLLPLIHVPEMTKLMVRKKEACILVLPLLFTLRNFVWVWAAVVWLLRYGLDKVKP